MEHDQAREELSVRLKWLMVSRIALMLFLLGGLFFFQYRYHIYEVRSAPLFYFAAVVFGLTALYWYWLRSFPQTTVLAHIQIFGDILLTTWLVALTGVIDSGFSIIYHITIISANIILARRGGYLAASFASIFYGGLLDIQYYNAFGYARSQAYSAGQVLFLLFINIVSFYAVAFLSGYLSDRLRKTRQELREKSSDFEDLRTLQNHILRSVGSGIVTMDMHGRITSWNNAAEIITGYGLDEIREMWKDVFGESIKNIFGHAEDMRSGPIRFDGEIIKKNSKHAVLGFTASLLKDDHDHVGGIILTFQDITRLMEMEERVRRQDRLATVGSLAAGIAHEIRNPLASLSGSIQMLREDLQLNNESRNLMDIVLRETDRLNTIITEFLDYARPMNGVVMPILLEPLVQDAVILFQNSKDYRRTISVSADVEKGVCISGDPSRIRQVIWNLLNNAAQAIDGRGEIRIHVRQVDEHTSRRIAVTVSDDGSGIQPEHLKTIFDPFFTTKTNGTGLGLAIVYRIIEDHRGTIDVESEAGKGTKITIKLPFSESPPAASEGEIRIASGKSGT